MVTWDRKTEILRYKNTENTGNKNISLCKILHKSTNSVFR